MSGPDAAGNGPLIHRRYVLGLLLCLCVKFIYAFFQLFCIS